MELDLVIIGAGPGGYSAAFMAADLGINVTLVDPEMNPGGVCLYRGCIPTKALLYLAKVKNNALDAKEMGFYFQEPGIKVDEVKKWKDGVVKKLTDGLGQLSRHRNINYIKGRATFTGSNEVEIKKEDGSSEKASFKNAIVATGARNIKIPGVDFGSSKILNAAGALELEDVPGKMLIVGAGYIGMEMGTIYHSLGTTISIAELTPHVLPGMDRDLVKIFEKSNPGLLQDVKLETKVLELKEENGQVKAVFEDKEGNKHEENFDKALIAVGMKPNTDLIGLENTGIEMDDKGFIKVDEQRRTTEKHILAIGDITGSPMLAHKANREGKVAAEVIAGKKSASYDVRAIPAVIYTDPEIAMCGLTEEEAKKSGKDYKIATFPWQASGRAIAEHDGNGLTKLLVEPGTERILGAGIVGKNAGDLIPELVLGIEMAATVEDIELSVHPHPSLSETIMEAAEVFHGYSTHVYKPKK